MTAIKDLVDQIDEELDGAKKYAEAYVQAVTKMETRITKTDAKTLICTNVKLLLS